MTDAVLVVNRKKLHVNKALLSYHSDYFNTLFNSNFKEKSMPEIEIKDVNFEDFAIMLSLNNTTPLKPNENRLEEYLKLADRFLLPAVKYHLEQLLLTSNTDNDYKLQLSITYKLNELLEQSLKTLKYPYCYSEFKNFIAQKFFKDLPAETQADVLNRYMDVIGY
ncbi:unnamed protein product [Caenorhabditis nigoni]